MFIKTIKMEIEDTLAKLCAETVVISGVHDIKIRKTKFGLAVSFHCRTKSESNFQFIQDALRHIERQARVCWPQIRRIVGRAEPAGLAEH